MVGMRADIKRDPVTRKWFGSFEYEKGFDPDLKRCPFCGERENLALFGTSINASYFVRCENCGAESGTHDLPDIKVNTRTRVAFEAAHREGFVQGIAAWNRRVTP